MARIERVLHTLLILTILVGFSAVSHTAAATIPGNTSRLYTYTDNAKYVLQTEEEIPDSYEHVGENEIFQLYADLDTLAFKVVDKRSGYIWQSNIDEKLEEDRLNRTWTAFATSGISIDYLDAKAISERASITNAEHSKDVRRIDQGFEASVHFTDASISVAVRVQLEPEGVRVDVPIESIKENGEFKLGLLHVYPFFGATREDSIPGYMFIPDGSGSLIRFGTETKADNMFYGKFYGHDLGMIAVLPYDPTVNRPYKLTIPVIGMVHREKQNAYIAIVEKGASYGEIRAHPAGIITNFNFLYTAFTYNESYFQATNRSGAGVTTLQRNTNAFDIEIHYRFLTGEDSDYVGMAQNYQQYLIDEGRLKKVEDQNSGIGIRLEFLGSEKEKVLFWNRSIPMTTISQMAEILDDLNIENKDVVYYGWQPYGASSMPPTSLKLDRSLGSIVSLRDLVEQVHVDGGNFNLYLDPQAALFEEGGYSARNDLALAITNVNMVGFNRYKVNFFFNWTTLRERYTSLSKEVSSNLKAGLALDTFGSMLYSDFKTNHFMNREQAIEAYRSLLAEDPGIASFYLPNAYMFDFMDAYYDMPLTSSGYIYTTDEVPFLQIVLAGHVPYYGPAINFSSNTRSDLLRQIDFGVYPSYFLSNEVTAKILNTRSNWIYTSSYGQWEEEVKRTYEWLNRLLGPVKGEEIIARETLADGVIATTYSNGIQVIVNYNDAPYSAGPTLISGKDAVVREVNP